MKQTSVHFALRKKRNHTSYKHEVFDKKRHTTFFIFFLCQWQRKCLGHMTPVVALHQIVIQVCKYVLGLDLEYKYTYKTYGHWKIISKNWFSVLQAQHNLRILIEMDDLQSFLAILFLSICPSCDFNLRKFVNCEGNYFCETRTSLQQDILARQPTHIQIHVHLNR